MTLKRAHTGSHRAFAADVALAANLAGPRRQFAGSNWSVRR